MSLRYKSTAFTLAEVLITLLIIGVVAGLVIPALIADTEKAETAVQVKKYQSVLSQAVLNIKNEYGSILNSPLNSNSDNANGWNAFKKYLNLTKDCNTTGRDCFANGIYKFINGNDWSNFNFYTGAKGIFNDGGSIFFEVTPTCAMNFSIYNSGPLYNNVCIFVFVDVNGHKSPNKAGRDVFSWYILQSGSLIPQGSLDDKLSGCDPNSQDVNYNDGNGAPGRGNDCTAKVIKEGKIDY